MSNTLGWARSGSNFGKNCARLLDSRTTSQVLPMPLHMHLYIHKGMLIIQKKSHSTKVRLMRMGVMAGCNIEVMLVECKILPLYSTYEVYRQDVLKTDSKWIALKCKSLGAYITRTRESMKAHMLMKWLHITESIRKTLETKEKEARCLTWSRIPGSV